MEVIVVAQMQWLGKLERPKSEAGYLAEAMGKGMESFAARRERERKAGLEERAMGLAEKQFQDGLKRMDYIKKKDTADMVVQVAKFLDKDVADDFINKPEIKALFEDLNWPLPTGLHGEVDLKDAAIDAVAQGKTLPGMTMEETKKAAGIFIAPTKVTREDIKEAKGERGFLESLPFLTGAAEKEWQRLKRTRREQLIGGSGDAASDPRGWRK